MPSNLNDCTAATVLFMMVSGGEEGGLADAFIHSDLQMRSFRVQ